MFKIKRKEAPKFSKDRNEELLLFQKKAKLNFTNLNLLNNAFIHSSYANESKDANISDNERLEFLGDSVLSVIVSEWLYKNIVTDEGVYTRIRSVVVSEESLSKIALSLELDKYIKIGRGEEQSGGRLKKAILADCMEAVIAAVYLDKGINEARTFVLTYLVPMIKDVLNNKHNKDYKTLLQEYSQKRYKTIPNYRLVKVEGPEHNQQFFYSVEVNGKVYGPRAGKNKKDAEQNVAGLVCSELGIEN